MVTLTILTRVLPRLPIIIPLTLTKVQQKPLTVALPTQIRERQRPHIAALTIQIRVPLRPPTQEEQPQLTIMELKEQVLKAMELETIQIQR